MVTASSLKRKHPSKDVASRKRARKVLSSSADLPWRTVPRAADATGDGDGGVLELEEVDNVRVIFQDTPGGRAVKFEVGMPNILGSDDYLARHAGRRGRWKRRRPNGRG
jgi:ATP-dependent RNA helicase DDX24/MAK5